MGGYLLPSFVFWFIPLHFTQPVWCTIFSAAAVSANCHAALTGVRSNPVFVPLRANQTFRHAADDDAVLVACGTAPDGRLASCKVGAALLPYTTDGPELSGSVNLFALCAPDGGGAAAADAAGRHTHLVFSFEALGRTDVMLVSSNDAMAQVELPGLRQNVASLLVANLEGDTAVQVTRSVVLALGLGAADAGGARSQWAPPGAPQEAITMGACRDGFVAVATSGSKVYCLAAGGGSSLAVVASGPAGGGQVAALALCRLGHLLDTQAAPPVLPPSASGAVPADLVVLVGEWMTNRVVAMRAADLAAPPLLVLDLGGETPRSFHLVPPPLSSPPSSSSSSPSTAPAPAAATLLIGTNGGSLLSGSVAAGGSTGGALQLQLRGLQQAKISHVAVQLQPLGGEQAQWVYAHSGSDAIVRVLPPTSAAAAGSSTSSSNTAQVEVVRVHGSPDCRAVVALDTPGMPESMAWVTSAGRLCFGRLDPSVRLRCSTAHVLDTPQHVAYHEPSGCAALLSSDEGGAQWLRLVHGGSLQQVVAMKLAPGHFYNSLAVLPLPCTSSQQHEGDKEGRQPSCKPFIVLSSYLLYADTLAPLPPTAPSPQQQGLYQMQGLLSFFDAAVEHPPNGQVSRYSLRLLGTCPIPGVAMSLATAQPEAAGPLPVSDAAPSGGTSTAAAALTATPASAAELARLLPCLVVGCNDGVRVYSAYVDDAGIEGQRAVAAALDGLSRPGPLPGSTISPATAAAQMEVDTPAAARPQPGAAAAAAALGAGAEATAEAAQSLEALALRDWSQQVELRELCSCVPAAAASCVTSLGSCGPVVFASEFMASVSTFKLVFNRQGHALVPLSADKHGIWAQAALPLSERTVLAAVHPAGLALLGRDTAAEDACIAVAAREAVAAHEAGRHRQMAVAANVNTAAGDAPAGGAAAGGRGAAGAAQRPDVHQALELSAASAPDMVAVGAANIGHSVYCMCLGRWGLAMRPWERTTARLSDAGAAQAARHSTLPQSALLFATSGAVAVVRQVGDDVSARELRQLQAAVDKLPSDALARLAEEDAAAASSSSCCCSHAAGESWRLRLPVSSSLPADSTAAVDDACTSGPLGAFVNGDVIRALLHRADPSPVGGGIASQSAQQNDCAVRQLAALMGAASSEVLAERLHHALSV